MRINKIMNKIFKNIISHFIANKLIQVKADIKKFDIIDSSND